MTNKKQYIKEEMTLEDPEETGSERMSSDDHEEMGPEGMSSEDREDSEYNTESGGAYYEIEDDEPDNHKGPKKKDSLSLIKLMFRLLISPKEGWKEIRRCRLTPDEVCRRLFYPLTGLAALSNFINLAYYTDRSVTKEVINGIVTFTSFFFSYFLVAVFGKILLKRKSAEIISTDFGKIFVAFSLSTLCLFFILYTALPMLEPIMVLLPLWTIFVITGGIKFLRIPETENATTTVWLSVLIVGLPVGVGYIFDIILGNR